MYSVTSFIYQQSRHGMVSGFLIRHLEFNPNNYFNVFIHIYYPFIYLA